MKKLSITAISLFTILAISGCANSSSSLTASSSLEKLKLAKVTCNEPDPVGTGLVCYDDSGAQYVVVIYNDETSIKEDLLKMCESGSYEDWAEGANWRAIPTDLVSSEQLAKALGGSVKKTLEACN